MIVVGYPISRASDSQQYTSNNIITLSSHSPILAINSYKNLLPNKNRIFAKIITRSFTALIISEETLQIRLCFALAHITLDTLHVIRKIKFN